MKHNFERLLTTIEVSKILHVHPSTVTRWCKNRAIACITRPHMEGAKTFFLIKDSTVKGVLNTFPECDDVTTQPLTEGD